MLSFTEKRFWQKVIVEQKTILAGNPPFAVKRQAQRAMAEAIAKLSGKPVIKNTGKIDAIEDLVNIALSRKDGNNAYAEIGEVTANVAEMVKQATGIDVTGFVHAVDESAIRHVFEKHGNEKKEASRGQVAVTNNDIANLANIVMSPDKIEQGDEENTIEVSKRVGSEVLVVQEIRARRKKLALKTMWKKPLAAHDAPQNESPAETPETDGKRALTNDLSIPQPPEKSNEPTSTGTPLSIPADSVR